MQTICTIRYATTRNRVQPMLCRPDCNASAVCGRAQRLSGRKRRAGVYNVAATVSCARAEVGIRAMGSCECYVVSCRARDREQPRCLCQRGGSAAAATYRGRGEGLRVAVGDVKLLAGDRRLVAECRVRYRDVGVGCVQSAFCAQNRRAHHELCVFALDCACERSCQPRLAWHCVFWRTRGKAHR